MSTWQIWGTFGAGDVLLASSMFMKGEEAGGIPMSLIELRAAAEDGQTARLLHEFDVPPEVWLTPEAEFTIASAMHQVFDAGWHAARMIEEWAGREESERTIVARAREVAAKVTPGVVHVCPEFSEDLPFDAIDTMASALRIIERGGGR